MKFFSCHTICRLENVSAEIYRAWIRETREQPELSDGKNVA
jgi:hypothetical protein